MQTSSTMESKFFSSKLDISRYSFLYQTLGYMKNWPTLISKFDAMHKLHWRKTPLPPINFQPQRDQCGEQFSLEEQRHFHAGLEILEDMRKLESDKDYSKVIFNMQIMIFFLWWVGNVRQIHLYFMLNTYIIVAGIC
jgi:hypothetical protein